tara:strand:- start:5 stop:235 length:231 start_codon:yes stop_codon:yes gene_type:complete
MIDDPISKHMNDVIDKREADLIKESKMTHPLMGEKEFFDVMKNANRHLTMEERFLIAELITAFTERRRQDEANGAM